MNCDGYSLYLTMSGMNNPEMEGTPVIWILRLEDTGFLRQSGQEKLSSRHGGADL